MSRLRSRLGVGVGLRLGRHLGGVLHIGRACRGTIELASEEFWNSGGVHARGLAQVTAKTYLNPSSRLGSTLPSQTSYSFLTASTGDGGTHTPHGV